MHNVYEMSIQRKLTFCSKVIFTWLANLVTLIQNFFQRRQLFFGIFFASFYSKLSPVKDPHVHSCSCTILFKYTACEFPIKVANIFEFRIYIKIFKNFYLAISNLPDFLISWDYLLVEMNNYYSVSLLAGPHLRAPDNWKAEINPNPWISIALLSHKRKMRNKLFLWNTNLIRGQV